MQIPMVQNQAQPPPTSQPYPRQRDVSPHPQPRYPSPHQHASHHQTPPPSLPPGAEMSLLGFPPGVPIPLQRKQ